MDHGAKDAHHGGVAVVELDDMLGEHCHFVECVLAKVNVALEGVVHKLVVGSFEILSEVEMRG